MGLNILFYPLAIPDLFYNVFTSKISVEGKGMEDFQAAFSERHNDVQALHDKRRLIASMHMGGVAIECLLKAMLCATLPSNATGEKEWTRRTHQPLAEH